MHNLKLLQLPKMFEVRWSQFTYSILNNVLTSWTCLVTFFQGSKDNLYIGHYKFLTNEFNIRLISILSDVLYIFSRYQKQLQSDVLYIISMDEKTNNFIKKN